MKLEDLKDDHMKRWSTKHLNVLFNAVKSTDHSYAELNDMAAEIIESEGIKRSVWAVQMALSRMQVLVHGFVPHDVSTGSLADWLDAPNTMVKFAKSKGLDVEENVRAARKEVQKRIDKKKNMITQPKATKIMADYYKENKATLPTNISKHRESIIKDLMVGGKVEDVFAKYD